MLPKESILGLKTNPVVMEIVRLCIRTTGKTTESLMTYLVLITSPDIYAKFPVSRTALARMVCYTSYSFSFDLRSNLFLFFLSRKVRYRVGVSYQVQIGIACCILKFVIKQRLTAQLTIALAN